MIHLVLGGARSGKSRWAEGITHSISQQASGAPLRYVATATAGDDEMAARIIRHQKDRSEKYDQQWSLTEEPFDLSSVIETANENDVMLIDCLTLYLTNWLCTEQRFPAWQEEKSRFIQALQSTSAAIVLVSNEVGSGVVPMGELSRQFVDEAGWLNQAVADMSDHVTLVVAGCPLALKRQGRLTSNDGVGL